MYHFIIYHDVGIKKEHHALIIDRASAGHVYLELRGKEDSIVRGILSGIDLDWMNLKTTYDTYCKYIVHGKERLELAQKYEFQHPNNKILYTKVIAISGEQYNKATQILIQYDSYLGKAIPSETYGVFVNNCAHFVNHIYRSIGLEGDYTRQYTAAELQEINTILTTQGYKTLGFFPGDNERVVFGTSRESVAQKYNIDKSLIHQKDTTFGIPDADLAMFVQAIDTFSFVILPNPNLVSITDHIEDTVIHNIDDLKKNMKDIACASFAQASSNIRIAEFLQDKIKLKQYQDDTLHDIKQELKEADKFLPSISANIIESSNSFLKEHGEWLASITSISQHQEQIKEAKEFIDSISSQSSTSSTMHNSTSSDTAHEISNSDTQESEAIDFTKTLLEASSLNQDTAEAGDIVNSMIGNIPDMNNIFDSTSFFESLDVSCNQSDILNISQVLESLDISHIASECLGEDSYFR